MMTCNCKIDKNFGLGQLMGVWSSERTEVAMDASYIRVLKQLAPSGYSDIVASDMKNNT